MSGYAERRSNMLTHYPEVASVGNLADALSRALGEQGSSLTAYSPGPPEEPTWSIFSDHPSAPGTTVPEFARVKTGKRACQVIIGWFEVPLGTFHLGFFDSYDWDEIADLDCLIHAHDLVTTAHIIRRALEHDAELSDLAEEFGVEFHRVPRTEEDLAVRDYLQLPEEERRREYERERARDYEILEMSEVRVRQILDELTGTELYECVQRTKRDRRRHIRTHHPQEAPPPKPGTVENMLNHVMQKMAEKPCDSGSHDALVELLSRSVAAYWSHLTEGNVVPGASAEDYLVSLARRSRKKR